MNDLGGFATSNTVGNLNFNRNPTVRADAAPAPMQVVMTETNVNIPQGAARNEEMTRVIEELNIRNQRLPPPQPQVLVRDEDSVIRFKNLDGALQKFNEKFPNTEKLKVFKRLSKEQERKWKEEDELTGSFSYYPGYGFKDKEQDDPLSRVNNPVEFNRLVRTLNTKFSFYQTPWRVVQHSGGYKINNFPKIKQDDVKGLSPDAIRVLADLTNELTGLVNNATDVSTTKKAYTDMKEKARKYYEQTGYNPLYGIWGVKPQSFMLMKNPL